MRKSELKTGMRSKLDNGGIRVVVGDGLFDMDGKWINSLRNYNDDLTNKYESSLNIVEIYKSPKSISNLFHSKRWTTKPYLLWNREDPYKKEREAFERGEKIQIRYNKGKGAGSWAEWEACSFPSIEAGFVEVRIKPTKTITVNGKEYSEETLQMALEAYARGRK